MGLADRPGQARRDFAQPHTSLAESHLWRGRRHYGKMLIDLWTNHAEAGRG